MVGRPKEWTYRYVLAEHVFDKVRLIDITLAEFETLLDTSAEVIEETAIDGERLKELVLFVQWRRPLHVVVVVDHVHQEERILTVYEPTSDRWADDYRRRR